MDLKTKLREQGYSVTAEGHLLCQRDASFRDKRYAHERVVTIKIECVDARIIDALITAVDEPRAAVGRNRQGAVLIFKYQSDELVLETTHSLETPAGDALSITVACAGAHVNIADYSWKRSPLDVARESLPPLFDVHMEVTVKMASQLGADTAKNMADTRRLNAKYERLAADIAAGRAKLESEDERAARIDAETVAENAHRDLVPSDGFGVQSILEARRRHAARQKKPQDAKSSDAWWLRWGSRG